MSKVPTSRLPVTPKPANPPKSGLRPPQPVSTSAAPSSSQQASPTGGDSSSNQFHIGDRVIANGKLGTIAFIGSTKFADGEWMGIILDETQGKNDGSYEGTRYFETEPNRGLFCRPSKVQRLTSNGANNATDISTPVKAQPTSSSTTSIPNVEKGDDADTTLINTTIVADTSANNNDQTVVAEPTPAPDSSSAQELRIGDRVVVSGSKFGILKYLGKIHVAEGIWCGIQLDEPLGKNDGSVSGKRYFTCQQRYGLFSPLARVEKVPNEMTQSQIEARKTSVSSNTNNNRQLQRSTSQESLHSNLSEFSTSSNSISRIPTRTPAKAQQQKLAANTNIYATPNTKSLLTQAAATLAAVTPSSNQIPNLVQTIKDKDIYIEKLQLQREQDRLEFSRAAQQVDEMELRLSAFQQKYDVKVAEAEELKKEQYQAKQRIEDLEFQLEEYKLTDANRDNSMTSTIPDGYRLLSPNDIEIYEQIKVKVVDLESLNQKLILEKQTLQDEHRQELKRQQESTESDYKTRLNELEEKYNNELKVNQTNNIETLRTEYETKLNDEIEKIQSEKQTEIEQLKSQITDLQNQEQIKTATLSEKETHYQQQLKEQESKLEQSTNELKEIRSQLSILQQEKQSNENQMNELLNELKQYRETIVPDFEKQLQSLQQELQNRDQAANSTLSERETQYEEKIKEYQSNIDQLNHEMEQLRVELKQIQEENLSKEKQTNDSIDTLKQEHEKKCEQLEHEFNEREQKLNSTLHERESQHEQEIKEYQTKLDQSTSQIQNIQDQLTQLQEEKTVNEKKSIETINTLKQEHERQYEILKTELTELQDRDRTQNMASNEREAHYEVQIKEYQAKRDQAVRESQDLRNELTKLQEEKSSTEKQLNDSINNLKQDFEKQIETFKTQINELENQNHTKANEGVEKDEQIKSYQSKLNELNKQIEQNQQEYDLKANQLQKEFDEKQKTQNEFSERFENLTKEHENLQTINETLKKDFEDLQNKHHDLENEHQKYLTSNEQLKSTNDHVLNEKQTLIDQLTKENNDMKQTQIELVEKQLNQHTHFEQQLTEDKTKYEKLLQEKIEEYEFKMQSMKSEFLLETQNSNLEHEQEKIRLKNQLQQALHSTENKTNSSAHPNVKQLEYELTEAKFQIEKLQRQIEANSTRDDRSALESQINFLNDVIVDLRNANEDLKKEIEFLKNPYAGEDGLTETETTRTKSSAPRLYCDMCEVFDQHDTDDCPKQNSMVDEQSNNEHHQHSHERVLPPPRLYCEKCEEFGHDCNEVDETY